MHLKMHTQFILFICCIHNTYISRSRDPYSIYIENIHVEKHILCAHKKHTHFMLLEIWISRMNIMCISKLYRDSIFILEMIKLCRDSIFNLEMNILFMSRDVVYSFTR